jgi:transposase
VVAVRRGQSQRAVARRFKVSLAVVQYWLSRAAQQDLKLVDWSDRPPRPQHHPQRTSPAVERRIVAARRQLQHSALGFVGAATIAQTLAAALGRKLPSVRTIGRVLRRQGLLDGRQRLRRPPPPPGWYLPLAASQRVALDAFDFIEDLALTGGRWLTVLTVRALAGPVCDAWPAAGSGTTAQVVLALQKHWQKHGRPGYAQFDNDLRFLGPTRYPDTLGQVVSLCLQLGVTPVFAPPAEHGLQNLVESFNHLWQAKVWARFHFPHVAAVRRRSAQVINALQHRWASRQEAAPPRKPFPKNWKFNPRARLKGEVILIRRTDAQGRIKVLGHQWLLDPQWSLRLVRAEVDLDAHEVRCYRLRRRAPEAQALLKTIPYRFPQGKRQTR